VSLRDFSDPSGQKSQLIVRLASPAALVSVRDVCRPSRL
jgi:hypothetical protein